VPYVIGRPSKFLALAGTIAGLLFVAQPAMADGGNQNSQGQNGQGQQWSQLPQVPAIPASTYASCPAVSSAQLLSQFGDSAYYSPLSGGTFEGSTAGWFFNDASVVSGNEPYYVVNSSDSNSLNLSPGGLAVSPSFCLDSGWPSFRFFAQSSGSSWGSLVVAVRWTDSQGNSGQALVSFLSASRYSSWTLTPSLGLGSALASGATVSAQIVFYATPGASWNVDDVLLDPYAK
jgi:hypothetical protein